MVHIGYWGMARGYSECLLEGRSMLTQRESSSYLERTWNKHLGSVILDTCICLTYLYTKGTIVVLVLNPCICLAFLFLKFIYLGSWFSKFYLGLPPNRIWVSHDSSVWSIQFSACCYVLFRNLLVHVILISQFWWFIVLIGGIVALGKFEALHIGHRELAIQASKAGTPFLLSFVGMAEVLGWEQRYRSLAVVYSNCLLTCRLLEKQFMMSLEVTFLFYSYPVLLNCDFVNSCK